MMRAAAVLLLALGSCGGAAAKVGVYPPTPTTVTVRLDETWRGVTFCVSEAPSAWVRADVLLTAEGPQVIAHELQHVRDIASFGSCAAFHAWKAEDPVRRSALLEASAFCASAKIDTASGRLTWDNALRMYGAQLAHSYPFGLSESEAEALIRRFCTAPPT